MALPLSFAVRRQIQPPDGGRRILRRLSLPELKLVVEVDGFSHDLRPDYDAARDRWFAGEGYRVLHVSNAEVLRNTEGVLAVIGEAIAQLRSQAHP